MSLAVSLCQQSDYNPETLRLSLIRLLKPFGGIGAFVKPGQRVLIKPNLLAGKAPGKAVTTHPELVHQVILLVQQAGGLATVGDSPGLGKPEQVARKCGLRAVIDATGANFAAFEDSLPVPFSGGTFHHLEVAREALETDVIINLPKLKTHQMMGYTGAVKNLFGLVVGARKARLHLQAGTDKAFFALMLLELAERFLPALNIMDAIVGMEGDGPGSGDPVQLGALLASPSPQALDTVAIRLVGLSEDRIWTQKVARQTGRQGVDIAEITLFGAPLGSLCVKSIRPAKSADINFGLPSPVKHLLKNALTAQPEITESCQLCGQCVTHCPPEAMHREGPKITIDLHLCIRCFCCQELCPHAAVTTRQGVLLRLADFLHGRQFPRSPEDAP